jgi:hypothetical protein
MHIIVDGLSGLDLAAKDVSGTMNDVEGVRRARDVGSINALPCPFNRILFLRSRRRGDGRYGRHSREVLLHIVEEVGGTTL